MNLVKKHLQQYLVRLLMVSIFAAFICNTSDAQKREHDRGISRKENTVRNQPSGNSISRQRNIDRGGMIASNNRNATIIHRSPQPNRNVNGNTRSYSTVRANPNTGNRMTAYNRNVTTTHRNNYNGNRVTTVNRNRVTSNIHANRSGNFRMNNYRYTTVRRNNYRPYTRAPYYYGGRRYYSYHPFFYHPYRPFYWGPTWHPWGFFVARIGIGAIILSIDNQRYYYNNGLYYMPYNNGYTVVQAPYGARINTLPPNAQTVIVNGTTNNYYYGGTYYEKSDNGYTVVPPVAGTIVYDLPEGGEEVTIGDFTYVKIGETYYQPIQVDGQDAYEVVDVQEDQ